MNILYSTISSSSVYNTMQGTFYVEYTVALVLLIKPDHRHQDWTMSPTLCEECCGIFNILHRKDSWDV